LSTSRKEKNEQVVAARVEANMADTRFAGLRTRSARVALAVTMIALIAIIPVVWVLFGVVSGILAVLIGFVVWWLLRMSVRLVADLPEEYLDERQSIMRNRLYVDAYRWLGGLVVLLASAGLVAFIVFGEDPETWKVALSYNGVMGIFWMLEAAALSIPSIVLALTDRELPRS
jgi:type IV secretory pathway VirB3-like protein